MRWLIKQDKCLVRWQIKQEQNFIKKTCIPLKPISSNAHLLHKTFFFPSYLGGEHPTKSGGEQPTDRLGTNKLFQTLTKRLVRTRLMTLDPRLNLLPRYKSFWNISKLTQFSIAFSGFLGIRGGFHVFTTHAMSWIGSFRTFFRIVSPVLWLSFLLSLWRRPNLGTGLSGSR